MTFDVNYALEAFTAAAILINTALSRVNRNAITSKVEEVHSEVKSTNGQTTAQNLENVITAINDSEMLHDVVPQETRRNGGAPSSPHQ